MFLPENLTRPGIEVGKDIETISKGMVEMIGDVCDRKKLKAYQSDQERQAKRAKEAGFKVLEGGKD